MSIPFVDGVFNEDGSANLLARLESRDGTGATQTTGLKLVKQADVTSIAVKVFDESSATPTTALVAGTAAPAVSAVISDTLATTWLVDSIGWNMRYFVPATVFTTGSHVYRVEIIFTLTSGEVCPTRWKGPAVEVYSS